MRDSSEIVLDIDGSATANGPWVPIPGVFAMSLQYSSQGTSAGTIKLQFSNDVYMPNSGIQPTVDVDIPSATVSVTAASKGGIAKIDSCYNWVRAVYTRTSGTGSIVARLKTNGY